MKKLTVPKGFTLIELMIVIAMVGIIASAAITFLDPLAQIRKANDAKRKSDLNQLQKSLELYYQDFERYPNEQSGLIESDGTVVDWGEGWTPYMARLPKDPAGGTYVYSVSANGQSYAVYAWLENIGKEPLVCHPSQDGKTCANTPAGVSCNKSFGCNYGISSPNITP